MGGKTTLYSEKQANSDLKEFAYLSKRLSLYLKKYLKHSGYSLHWKIKAKQ